MEVPAIGAPAGPGDVRALGRAAEKAGLDRVSRALRARWRTASLASGWRFPSDWSLPEVDAVCGAVAAGRCAEAAIGALAGARAAAGAGLAETLGDLAALHAVLDDEGASDGFVAPDVDATPSRLLRISAIGWAEVALEQLGHAGVTEPLTGLPTPAYLRTRLAELYRAAEREGRTAAENHTLLVVAVDFADAAGWARLTGMILVADTLQRIFDGGETLVALGPSTGAVLVPRDSSLAGRALALRRELAERLTRDEQLHELGIPAISLARLPGTYAGACALVADLGRR
ncbi:GGDEF domain-containing protein [Amycolatopsis antarctica]|uniref:GGDEF domain-containing protein n=1 Tax=Amycolatopsis antarctica TaxID=1854586 RepID=A0A263DC53_9PSEU|nr:GGDEF domain-containing protein [Amycolatopsis antarctica]OZM75077.1 GGDEF domain-containing protein [Amycolatopsis antarctica]